jgi:hypothetical protein
VTNESAERAGYDIAIALMSVPRERVNETVGRCVEHLADAWIASPGSGAIATHAALGMLADAVLQLRPPFTREQRQQVRDEISLQMLGRQLGADTKEYDND